MTCRVDITPVDVCDVTDTGEGSAFYYHEAEDWLDRNGKYIRDAMVEAGLRAIESLLVDDPPPPPNGHIHDL